MRYSLTTAIGLAALSACEYRAVVGMREPGDLVTEDESSEGDLPSLDIPVQACDPPAEIGCDALDDDPLHAVGLDCIGGTPASGGVTANAAAWSVHAGTLGPGTYPPREGEKFLILSTGRASELPLSAEQLEQLGCTEPNFCPNTDFEQHDEFPAPITVAPVDAALTCVDQPQLVGTGDCSNSLGAQCNASCDVRDYAELRIGLTVPEATYGLAFDFAFMSVEWPDFTGAGFNDMFVAWLESEQWTGNVSFDAEGNPITVNAGFLDYQASAELEGFAMAGHGATRWLTTHFGVVPGENVLLVLAVLDLADGYYDSAVLLDHFRWTCSDAPPITQPQP